MAACCSSIPTKTASSRSSWKTATWWWPSSTGRGAGATRRSSKSTAFALELAAAEVPVVPPAGAASRPGAKGLSLLGEPPTLALLHRTSHGTHRFTGGHTLCGPRTRTGSTWDHAEPDRPLHRPAACRGPARPFATATGWTHAPTASARCKCCWPAASCPKAPSARPGNRRAEQALASLVAAAFDATAPLTTCACTATATWAMCCGARRIARPARGGPGRRDARPGRAGPVDAGIGRPRVTMAAAAQQACWRATSSSANSTTASER
jgi:hypothetical protein